jgi:hypothetical protein
MARTGILTKCEIESNRSAKDIGKVLSAYMAIPYHLICRRVGANRPRRKASVCRPTLDHALSYLPVEIKNSQTQLSLIEENLVSVLGKTL